MRRADLTMETKIALRLLPGVDQKGNFGLSVCFEQHTENHFDGSVESIPSSRDVAGQLVIFIARETVRLVIEQMQIDGISPDDISPISSELDVGGGDLFQNGERPSTLVSAPHHRGINRPCCVHFAK